MPRRTDPAPGLPIALRIAFAAALVGCTPCEVAGFDELDSGAADGRPRWQDTISGSAGGVRPALAESGIEFSLDYIGDLFVNLAGGRSTGGAYRGLGELRVDADLEPSLGLMGVRMSLNVLALHGDSPSEERVGDDLLVSNIDAASNVRLQNL